MKRLPELVLVLLTAVWGGTFLATRVALQGTGPFTLLLLRFTLAAVLVGLFVRRRPNRQEVIGALIVSVSIAVAFATQTVALQTIDSSRAAFLIAFYVPLVPILQGPLTGRRPTNGAVVGVALAFLGLIALASGDGLSLSLSVADALVLVGALASALQIVLVSRFASSGNPATITTVQLAGVALMSLSGATVEGLQMTPTALMIGVGLGVVATAAALFAMNWAQRTVPPAKATLIYAMEPVWAALFGVLAGERLGHWSLVGGGLVVAGAIASELIPENRKAVAEAG